MRRWGREQLKRLDERVVGRAWPISPSAAVQVESAALGAGSASEEPTVAALLHDGWIASYGVPYFYRAALIGIGVGGVPLAAMILFLTLVFGGPVFLVLVLPARDHGSDCRLRRLESRRDFLHGRSSGAVGAQRSRARACHG